MKAVDRNDWRRRRKRRRFCSSSLAGGAHGGEASSEFLVLVEVADWLLNSGDCNRS